jgi:hypothetical protein
MGRRSRIYTLRDMQRFILLVSLEKGIAPRGNIDPAGNGLLSLSAQSGTITPFKHYRDYQVPFRFTGKIAKLTYRLGPVRLASEEQKILRHALAGARD